MGEQTVDALYEQVRQAVPAVTEDVPEGAGRVAPGIRRLALRTPTLPPAAHTNVYLVGPEVGPQVVVDPGSPYPDQQAVLDGVLAADRDAGRPLAMVLLTHHHGDHVGGAAVLAARWGVPIAAHARTAQRLAGRVAVARELADDEVVQDLRCLYTPGHADGHLCYEHAAGGTIAGDMVAGLGWILIDPDEGDMTDYLASLERLRGRPPGLLLPAHGPPIPDSRGKLTEYIAHRTMREDKVVAALARRGGTLAELVPDVYADTPRMLWPLAERSLRAHLDKLVREGRVHEHAGRWQAALDSSL